MGREGKIPSELPSLPLSACITWAKRFSGLTFLVLGLLWAWREAEDVDLPGGARALSASKSGGTCESHDDGHVSHSLENTLCFLLVCCLACAALDHWNVIVPADWRLPISVVVFMSGMGIGVIFLKVVDSSEDNFIAGMQGSSYLDPHAIFFVLLPPLLFESAGSMSWHVLYRVLPSSVLLAGPGVVLNTFLVGAFAKVGLHVEGVGAMGWEAALLLASILSATDPVAVVAALHSLGAPKKLATLIEGESLLNDGSAVVFFGVFLDMAATHAPESTKICPGVPPELGCVSLYFLRLALGGPALGLVFGFVLYQWIGWARQRESPVLEISITLTAIYGVFFIAESLIVSGVLAVVSLGIFATACIFVRMSHEGRHALHLVLAQITYTCNHVIFFSAGTISARFMWSATRCMAIYQSPRAWLELLLLYVVLHVSRALVITLFSPLLSRLGYGITWKEGAVLVWGGLRGAVGLAMGLLVEHKDFFDERIAAVIAFHVSGIVVLTLVVNGITVDNLYRALQPYPPNPYHLTYLRKTLNILEEECGEKVVKTMKRDWFFQDIDYDSIMGCVPNFSRIEFSAARVPYPAGIWSVKETLQCLELGATQFNLSLSEKQYEMRIKSLERSDNSWEQLKDANRSAFLTALLDSATSGTGRDLLLNVQNSGDERMEYKADNSCTKGLYCSARPLSQVSETATFSVKILCLQGVHTIIGLAGRDDAGGPSPLKKELLGSTLNSVGLDLLTGILRCNGPSGERTVQPPEDFEPVSEGSIVQVSAMVVEGEGLQVDFSVEDDGSQVIASCVLGGVPVEQLFPAIQFTPPQLSQKSKILRRPSSFESTESSHAAKVLSATLHLSYEPQTASDAESLRQLFHVLFNMVVHEYHEMHDRGLLGNEAFDWLLTAVEKGTDNAEGELNRTRVQDLKRLEKFCMEPTLRTPLEGLQEGSNTFLHVFEPLLVEYLEIEERCATQSVVDRLSKSWKLFRSYDYHRVLVKVEALWGFIEAHELTLSKYTAMEKYPDLVKCLEMIMAEAKRDLAVIEQMKARRFWYSKHFLALKVLMTKKRETLCDFAKEGWLARDDCEHLSKALRDRCLEVEHFVPRLYRRQEGKSRASTFVRGAAQEGLAPVAMPKGLERAAAREQSEEEVKSVSQYGKSEPSLGVTTVSDGENQSPISESVLGLPGCISDSTR